MTHTTTHLTCDCCHCQAFNGGDETEAEARQSAQLAGWTLRRVPNGADWDLCRECSKIETENLP